MFDETLEPHLCDATQPCDSLQDAQMFPARDLLKRLVAVAIAAPGSNAPISSFSYPVFRELREKNSVFAGMFAYPAMPMSMSDGGQVENDH